MSWPLGLGFSILFHGIVVGAIIYAPKSVPPPENAKVTWVTMPAAMSKGPSGGAAPMEEGHQGERQRRVEEVAPQNPVAKGAAPTPNVFGDKKTNPAKGTNPDLTSVGKAPVAAKGKNPTTSPTPGAAGHGGGYGIGEGVGLPGLKATEGVSGGTGLISDIDGNFPFTIYLQQAQERITGNWSRLSSVQGRVQIYFRINRDGTLDGIRIEMPSGNEALDQSALLAVKRSNPLARLPEGFESQTLGIKLWFSYVGK